MTWKCKFETHIFKFKVGSGSQSDSDSELMVNVQSCLLMLRFSSHSSRFNLKLGQDQIGEELELENPDLPSHHITIGILLIHNVG